MDDSVAVTALLLAARALRDARPETSIWFSLAARKSAASAAPTPAARCWLYKSAFTEAEYSTSVGDGPIIAYSDAQCIYDRDVADRLMNIAAALGLSPQPAVLGAFESDASHANAAGLTPKAGLLCMPTLSTHGSDVIAHPSRP